ncbi:MAG: CcdB family protein [Nitrococcus sp.]|nr:CcdB family protein [Nitrococcus sp.]
MPQYDIYRGDEHPLLDMQVDLLDGLNTRIVAPLISNESAPAAASRLNPVFVLEGHRRNMVTQYMASVPVAALGMRIATLESDADRRAAKAAVDFLFDGF